MTDIDKAAQEAWDLFEAAPMWTREGNFRKGFRAGAEWRDKQRPSKTEALKAINIVQSQTITSVYGAIYTMRELYPTAFDTIRHALTSERAVPEGYTVVPEEVQDAIELLQLHVDGYWVDITHLREAMATIRCALTSEREVPEESTIAESLENLGRAMRADPSYAWSWHCNLAMMAQDAGAPHKEANEQARGFMWSCFGVNTFDPDAPEPEEGK